VYDNNSVKVEKMCIRRVAISAIPPAQDDTSFEEDTASVTHTHITLPGWQRRRDGIWLFPGREARIQVGISACFAWTGSGIGGGK